jgi:hypothetical protein
MRKSLLISVLLLACATWLQAQAYPQSSATQAAGGGTTTVQGCLSGAAGSYTLTADSGTTYALTGNTSELKDHVGHEVAITGKASAASASSSSSAASTTGAAAGGAQTLEVASMKHVATSCKSAAK